MRKTRVWRGNKPQVQGHTASRQQSQGLSPDILTAWTQPHITLRSQLRCFQDSADHVDQSKTLIYRWGNKGPEEREEACFSGCTRLGTSSLDSRTSQVHQKNRPWAAGGAGDGGSVPGSGRSPAEGMATHSPGFLPGQSPWREGPGRLQFKGLQRVTWLGD